MKKKKVIETKIISEYPTKPKNGGIFIYIMINPSHPDWVKVGRTDNIKGRLNTYNTSHPHRDCKMLYWVELNSNKVRFIEKLLSFGLNPKNE